MMPRRLGSLPVIFLVLSLAMAACGAATPEIDVQRSPLPQLSPLPTATNSPTPPPTFTPLPTPTPALASVQLVVLHTNDDWGETEPCG